MSASPPENTCLLRQTPQGVIKPLRGTSNPSGVIKPRSTVTSRIRRIGGFSCIYFTRALVSPVVTEREYPLREWVCLSSLGRESGASFAKHAVVGWLDSGNVGYGL